jgi:hypothetical protein
MLHSQHFLFVTLSEFVGAATVPIQQFLLPIRLKSVSSLVLNLMKFGMGGVVFKPGNIVNI